MAREPRAERAARRRAALEANGRRLEKKIGLKGDDHPLAPALKQTLERNTKVSEIHRLHGEIERLQKPGDHSIEVPSGDLAARGQKAEG